MDNIIKVVVKKKPKRCKECVFYTIIRNGVGQVRHIKCSLTGDGIIHKDKIGVFNKCPLETEQAPQPEFINANKTASDQTAKADAGKLRLSLVPTQIIRDVAEVREWATKHKYRDPENWRTVEIKRYVDAAYRHILDMIDDPLSVDKDSGLRHYKHIACNMAFICELEKARLNTEDA